MLRLPASRLRSAAAAAWTVPLILFVGIMAADLHGSMGCSDSRWSIPTAVSLLDQHNFDLDEYLPLLQDRGFFFTEHVGEHYYTVYPFGASILAAPAVVILRPIAAVVARRWPPVWTSMRNAQWARGCPPAGGEPIVDLHSWTEQIVASAIVALTALLLFAIARDELPVPDAAILALIFAFGTSAWSTASRSLWQHGPSMLMLAAALYFQRRRAWPVAVGIALAFAYVVRPTNLVPLIIGIAWATWVDSRRLGVYLLGAAVVLIPFFAINLHVYGAWLSPYYHPAYHHGNLFFWEALAGGLVSPGRGLFVYSPVLAFAPIGILLKVQQRRFTALDLALLASVLLYWISTAWVNPSWSGGDSYGPRFSSDLLPYLTHWLIPVIGWLRHGRTWSASPQASALRSAKAPRYEAGRAMIAAVFVATTMVSVLMHAQGVFNPAAMAWNREPVSLTEDPARLWDWRHPPFLAGFVAPSVVEPLPDLRAIPCDAAPGAPTDLTIDSNRRNTVSASWHPGSGPIGFYTVESGTAPGSSDLPSRETRTPALTVTHVAPGTYYARVRARNACGVSGPSNEITLVVD